MVRSVILIFPLFLAVAWSQSLQPSTTPVPILKQINRQNDDGSYSYGYENADGSYKIETKFKNGEVYGKYGYVGADGKLREVEYGATKLGFQPAGSDIDVPPPTIVNENALQNADYDDGQYREDPSIYWKTDKFNSVPAKSAPAAVKSAPTASPSSAPSRQTWSAPQQQTRSWSAPQTASWNVAPQQNWNFAPAQQQVQSWQAPQQSQWEAPQPVWSPPQQRSWTQPQQTWQAPVQQSWTPPQQGSESNLALFVGHPAKNFDLATGSYSISYNG